MAASYAHIAGRTLVRSAPKTRLDFFQAGSIRSMSNLVNSSQNKAFLVDAGALAKELELRGVPPCHTETVMEVLNDQKAQHRLSAMQDDIKKMKFEAERLRREFDKVKESNFNFGFFLWCSALTVVTATNIFK